MENNCKIHFVDNEHDYDLLRADCVLCLQYYIQKLSYVPIDNCILEGNVACVDYILSKYNRRTKKNLVQAALLSAKSSEMLKLLIMKHNADPNEEIEYGFTPLYAAIDYAKNDATYDIKTVVTTLIQLGADPRREVCSGNVISTPYSRSTPEIQDLIDDMEMEMKGFDE